MIDELFESKCIPGENGCIEYPHSVTQNGYGRVRRRKVRAKRTITAHRYSYMINRGPIPEGMFACHKCDNRKCVNPDHLFIGTLQDNVDDMMRKGRHVTVDQKGVNNGNSKLTSEQLIEIRTRIAAKEPNTHIARDYAITHQMVSNIKLGKSHN